MSLFGPWSIAAIIVGELDEKETQTERLEHWFKHGSFLAHKKGVPVRFVRNEGEGVLETLEGPVKYVAGSVTIFPNGAKDKPYPVSESKFKQLYEEDSKNGTAIPKKITKQVKLADRDGTVYTKWGDLAYNSGKHYIVRHGEGDYGVVEKRIFKETYERSA